jgi:hypothetical protein
MKPTFLFLILWYTINEYWAMGQKYTFYVLAEELAECIGRDVEDGKQNA